MKQLHILTYLTNFNRVQFFKALLALIFLLITSFVYLHWSLYPLRLTLNQGYLVQVPLSYWGVLSMSFATLTALACVKQTRVMSLIATLVFFLLFGSYQFLFRGLFGGDYTIRNYALLHRDEHFSPEIHFSYFQFSQSWILHRIEYVVALNKLDTLTTIEFGFFIYVVLFGIAVWYFAYENLHNPFHAFLASTVFFVMVKSFLNFQYVPQFFALILLLFLLAIHHHDGPTWFGLKLLLFVALVLSHPMFFVFYLGAALALPLIHSALSGLGGTETTCDRAFGIAILHSIAAPSKFVRRVFSAIQRSFTNASWHTFAFSILSIYLIFFLYRFIQWQRSMTYSLFMSEHRGHTAQLLQRFGIDIWYDLEEQEAVIEASTQPLYHLSSLEISTALTDASIALVIVTGLLLAILSLAKPIDRYRPFNLSVAFIALSYLIAGIAFNILGTRALQALFIPFMLSISMIKRWKTIGIIIIVLILMTSPVLVANGLNNAELAGGHTTGDFYTEQAGQFLHDYEYDTVIQARTTQYPVDVSGERDHINIRNLLDLPERDTYETSSGDIIQFDYRLYHDVDRHFHTCNYEEQHVIYDNTNQLMVVGGNAFECYRYD